MLAKSTQNSIIYGIVNTLILANQIHLVYYYIYLTLLNFFLKKKNLSPGT